MCEFQDETKSRGFSILEAIVLIAMLGGAASIIQPSLPPYLNPDQLAASLLAVEEPDKKTTVSDTPESGTTSCVGRSGAIIVHYACYQQGDVSKIKELVQTGAPGFEYAVTAAVTADNKGIITVQPRALISPSFSCVLPVPPTCQTGNKPAIASVSTDKSRIKVDEKAQNAVAEDLSKLSAPELQEILPELRETGVISDVQQDALRSVLARKAVEESVYNKATSIRHDIASELDEIANCFDAGCEAQREDLMGLDLKYKDIESAVAKRLELSNRDQWAVLTGDTSVAASDPEKPPSPGNLKQAEGSTFTIGGKAGDVASGKEGGFWASIAGGFYVVGNTALKLPQAAAEAVARAGPAVRTIITGLPEGVKIAGGNVIVKAAPKAGMAIAGPIGGAVALWVGAAELGGAIGDAAGEYFFGPMSDEGRAREVLGVLDELPKANRTEPGYTGAETVEELARQLGIAPAAREVRASFPDTVIEPVPFTPASPASGGVSMRSPLTDATPARQAPDLAPSAIPETRAHAVGSDAVAPSMLDTRAMRVADDAFAPVDFSRVTPASGEIGIPAFPDTTAVQRAPDVRAISDTSAGGAQIDTATDRALAPLGVDSLVTPAATEDRSFLSTLYRNVRSTVSDIVLVPLGGVESVRPIADEGVSPVGASRPATAVSVDIEPPIAPEARATLVGADASPLAIPDVRAGRTTDDFAQPIDFSRVHPATEYIVTPVFSDASRAGYASDERAVGASDAVGRTTPDEVVSPIYSGKEATLVPYAPARAQDPDIRVAFVPADAEANPVRSDVTALAAPDVRTTAAPDDIASPLSFSPASLLPDTIIEPVLSTVGKVTKWSIAGIVGVWVLPTLIPESPAPPPPPAGGSAPPTIAPIPDLSSAPDDKSKEKKSTSSAPPAGSDANSKTPAPPPRPEAEPQQKPETPPQGAPQTPPPEPPGVRADTPVFLGEAGTPIAAPQGQMSIFSGLGQFLGRVLGTLFRGSAPSQSVTAPDPKSSAPAPVSERLPVPIAIIVPNPGEIRAGETSTLSWASVFTRSCSVSSADGAVLVEDGKPDGSVKTPLLSKTTAFSIRCAPNTTATSSAHASTTVTVR